MHFPVYCKLNFDATNNVSEYEACILGLSLALDMDIRRLAVFGDSELVIKQSTEKYATRDAKLILYRRCLFDLCQNFDYVEFNHIPQDQNDFVDALATLSFMIKVPNLDEIPPLTIEARSSPAYCYQIGEESGDKPWYFDIVNFLEK